MPVSCFSGRRALQPGIDVLVIAADRPLRRSIVFLLEGEGLKAAAFDAPASALAASSRARCLVLDERDLAGSAGLMPSLARLAARIILLRDGLDATPLPADAIVLMKPLLGDVLVDAIRGAPGEPFRRGAPAAQMGS